MRFTIPRIALLVGLAPFGFADDGSHLLRIDHYVQVHSSVPAIAGQATEIYVREVVEAATVLRGGPAADRVALFIHGAGTPAEVAFDVPHQDYSWMAYLAHAGFDVFSMDMTGYGRSTRPPAMNDPCNLAREQQAAFVPALIPAPCAASYPHQMTTLASDWHDIDAVVDRIRALRHVEKLNILAWSLGGPRSGGYAAQHADKVAKLVLLAPAYNRAATAEPPAQVPANGAAMNTQSRDEFIAIGIARSAARPNTKPLRATPSGRKCFVPTPSAQPGEAVCAARRRSPPGDGPRRWWPRPKFPR